MERARALRHNVAGGLNSRTERIMVAYYSPFVKRQGVRRQKARYGDRRSRARDLRGKPSVSRLESIVMDHRDRPTDH